MRVSFSTEHKGLKGPYILGVKPATIMCKRQANTVDATQSRCLPALKAVLWIELREKLREKLRVGLFAILTVSLFTQVATAQESTGENADENASENAGENAGAGKGPKPSSEIKKGSAQSPEKKKSKKPKKRKKRAQDTQNKQNQPAKQEVAKPAAKKPQRFEILSVSDQTVAIEYTRPDASLKVGDLMYVVHGEQKGFVAVLEIELVEYAQKSLTARLIENDVEFSDNVTLSGLEVFTHQKFLEVADEYSQGPLHPKVPSAVSFF